MTKHRSEVIELVKSQYSGNTHGVIDGIGMVNAIWCDPESEEYMPVDFRIYDKESDGKTKNDHFREMLTLALSRKLNFSVVVFDVWYSSLNNLKAVRDAGKLWVTGLKKNRKINRKYAASYLLALNQVRRKCHLDFFVMCSYRIVSR